MPLALRRHQAKDVRFLRFNFTGSTLLPVTLSLRLLFGRCFKTASILNGSKIRSFVQSDCDQSSYQALENLIWSIEMDDLISRIVYHPKVAHPAIYLTEIMARADSSIGAAIVVAGRRTCYTTAAVVTSRPKE